MIMPQDILFDEQFDIISSKYKYVAIQIETIGTIFTHKIFFPTTKTL